MRNLDPHPTLEDERRPRPVRARLGSGVGDPFRNLPEDSGVRCGCRNGYSEQLSKWIPEMKLDVNTHRWIETIIGLQGSEAGGQVSIGNRRSGSALWRLPHEVQSQG